ncbi:hypothetical protein [Desulfovibrio ferrophilus]|nr:hypothetical protein [Desulfovibrio ferrophilus]
MYRIIAALVLVLVLAVPTHAENTGDVLLQCVTLKWDAGKTYPPQVKVEAWVFGKSVATGLLDQKNSIFEFEFEDGFVVAKGKVSASFVAYDGKGKLKLESMEAGCDFSGSFPLKPRHLADFEFEAKFDY